MGRPGFDTSPLLDGVFKQAELDYIKGIAPEAVNADPENIPELLIHTVKRINKNPTATMLKNAQIATQLQVAQITAVWDAMWASA